MNRRLEESVFVDNATYQHVAAVLLLDISGSMKGTNISELNEGLKVFRDAVKGNPIASRSVDVAVVTFNDVVEIVHDFSGIDDFDPPTLSAEGRTAMGEAILRAADIVEKRKQVYKDNGVDYYRPWIFMITDAELEGLDMQPGDAKWNKVRGVIQDGETSKKFLFFCVGVNDADMDVLSKLAQKSFPAIKLKEKQFEEMFLWLSKSLEITLQNKPGEQTTIQTPAQSGWGFES